MLIVAGIIKETLEIAGVFGGNLRYER